MPSAVWKTPWVVHAQPAGTGVHVLEYLARSVFRIAISHSRIDRIEDGHVTVRYRDNRTQHLRRVTLPALEFLAHFLQHVLPRGCTNVRYYGIWSSARWTDLDQARTLLSGEPAPPTTAPAPAVTAAEPPSLPVPALCPHCRVGHLIVMDVFRPLRRVPP